MDFDLTRFLIATAGQILAAFVGFRWGVDREKDRVRREIRRLRRTADKAP